MELPDGLREIVSSVEVARPQPGDIIVLRTAERLSADTCRRIGAYAQDAFPGLKVVVLDSGMTLQVVRPDEAKA